MFTVAFGDPDAKLVQSHGHRPNETIIQGLTPTAVASAAMCLSWNLQYRNPETSTAAMHVALEISDERSGAVGSYL